MQNCIRCGAHLEGLDVGGDGICQNCEAAMGTDSPCQRCGACLPPHALRMWNSRLYCAHCIMDLQDEERRGRAGTRKEQEACEGGFPFGFGGGRGTPQEGWKQPQACERCGREAEELYSSQGRRLCLQCHSDGGAGESSSTKPGGAGAVVTAILGIMRPNRKPAKIVAVEQPDRRVFDPKTRAMVERKGAPAPKPLSEGRQDEKKGGVQAKRRRKTNKEAREEFFSSHPSLESQKKED